MGTLFNWTVFAPSWCSSHSTDYCWHLFVFIYISITDFYYDGFTKLCILETNNNKKHKVFTVCQWVLTPICFVNYLIDISQFHQYWLISLIFIRILMPDFTDLKVGMIRLWYLPSTMISVSVLSDIIVTRAYLITIITIL